MPSSDVPGGRIATTSSSSSSSSRRQPRIAGIVLRKKRFVLCVAGMCGVRRVGEQRWFRPSAFLRMNDMQLDAHIFRRMFASLEERYDVRQLPEFKAALPELGELVRALKDQFMRYRREVSWLSPAPSSCHGDNTKKKKKKKKKKATRYGRPVFPRNRTLVFFRDRRPGHLQYEFVTKTQAQGTEHKQATQVLAQLRKLGWSRLM